MIIVGEKEQSLLTGSRMLLRLKYVNTCWDGFFDKVGSVGELPSASPS